MGFRRIFIVLYLLWLSTASFGQKINYKETDSLTKAGKYQDAIDLFNKYKKKNADDYELYKGRAYCYLQLGKINQAQADYNKAIKLNPECSRCYLNYALLENLKSKLDSALFYINKAIGVSDTDAYNYVVRGQIYSLRGENFSAEEDFDKAVSMHPKIAEYYFYRSRFEDSRKRISSAFFDLNKAVELQPSNGFFYFSRAEYYYEGNQLLPALNDLDTAIYLGYKNAKAYHHRAVILSYTGRQNEAMRDMNTAIKADSTDEALYVTRGTLFFNSENMDLACNDFVKAKILLRNNPQASQADIYNVNSFLNEYCNPTHASWYYERGIGEYNRKNFKNAIAYYDAGHDKFPTNPLMEMLEGSSYLALNDLQGAVQYYKTSLSKKDLFAAALKENAEYRYLYGGAIGQYSSPGGDNDSLKEVTDFYILSAYERMANAELALGDYTLAKKYIDTAINMGEKNKPIGMEIIYTTRGRYYLLMGQPKLAMQDFGRAISLNDKFPEPYTLHAQAVLLFSQPAGSKTISVVLNIANPGFMLKSEDLLAYTSPKAQYDTVFLDVAIADCGQAIKLAPSLENAYLIRGCIKTLMKDHSCCDDFSKAKLLGSDIAKEFEAKFCR